MAISQNFKTQVVFGGRIDPSFRRGTTELNDAIRQTSSTVGKLTKSQDKLKDKIAAMKLAGKDVSDLSAQYQKLDRRIKATTQDQEALNTQLAKNSGWRSGRVAQKELQMGRTSRRRCGEGYGAGYQMGDTWRGRAHWRCCSWCAGNECRDVRKTRSGEVLRRWRRKIRCVGKYW